MENNITTKKEKLQKVFNVIQIICSVISIIGFLLITYAIIEIIMKGQENELSKIGLVIILVYGIIALIALGIALILCLIFLGIKKGKLFLISYSCYLLICIISLIYLNF